ncbi:MAG TPA: CPBP family intramembrane glutamic endopeptidase [Phycisphaerae bacterium]|nr:CPBP family intramembrane glutamic endopeptidase [Phycisphaerae bacterium]
MPSRKRTDWLEIGSGKSYLHRVHRPLQCLIFIMPLLLVYQIASALHPWTSEQAANGVTYSPHVVAFVLMLKFFALFGAVGNILPPLAVVAILVFWHLARKDQWEFNPKLYMGMFGESILWALPIFVIGLAVTRHAAPGFASLQAAGSQSPPLAAAGELPWQTEAVLSIGAGIYEELLFRLVAIIILNIILVDIFDLKASTAIPIIILTSAILFAAYHYLGAEHFNPATFAFRSAMGVYLAGIFIYRGFGIAVGTHTTYDLIVVAFTHLH